MTDVRIDLNGDAFGVQFQSTDYDKFVTVLQVARRMKNDTPAVKRADLVRGMTDEELASFMSMVAIRAANMIANEFGFAYEPDPERMEALKKTHLLFLQQEAE